MPTINQLIKKSRVKPLRPLRTLRAIKKYVKRKNKNEPILSDAPIGF